MAQFQHGDLAYRYIVEEVLRSGTRKENRTGVDLFQAFRKKHGGRTHGR